MAQQLSTLGLHQTGDDKLLKTKRQPRAARIKANSTTDRVHQFLLKNPTRWYRLSQIAVGTGCRDKTVSWALHQLKAQGLVEAVTLSRQANSRYLRYCITRESTLT
jgi:predicted transcriptional regulator